LPPDTELYLIVYASDTAGNRLTKSILLKTKNPIIKQVGNLITKTSGALSSPSFLRSRISCSCYITAADIGIISILFSFFTISIIGTVNLWV